MKKVTGEERRHMMLEESLWKVIPRLAIPSVIAMLVDSIYNLADTYFVSSLGESATAAVAVNDSFMNILFAMSACFGFGAASCISRLLGAKEDKRASELASSTLVMALIVCAVAISFLYPLRKKVVLFLGVTEDSLPYAIDYAEWILFAFPFTSCTMVLNNILKSEGNARLAMMGTVSGCIVNCVLDPIFIKVLGLEVAGAAIATAISKMISVIVLSIPFIKKRTMVVLSIKNATMKRRDIGDVIRVGFPSFLRSALMSVGGILTNNQAKVFGTAILAGISIANKIYRLIVSFLMGFGQGFGPVVGFCYGAQKYKRAKNAYLTTVKIGAILSLTIGAVFYIIAPNAINIFNGGNNPVVTQIGVAKLRLLCIGFLPHIFTVITDNTYQALGKMVQNAILAMSRQVIFLIPLLLILPKFLNEYGVAYAQGISDIAAGFLLALPFAIAFIRGMNKSVDGQPCKF